jgi:CSLREA domain-containing protein
MQSPKTAFQFLNRRPARTVALLLVSLVLALSATWLTLGGVNASTLGKFGITEQSRVGKLLGKLAPQAFRSAPRDAAQGEAALKLPKKRSEDESLQKAMETARYRAHEDVGASWPLTIDPTLAQVGSPATDGNGNQSDPSADDAEAAYFFAPVITITSSMSIVQGDSATSVFHSITVSDASAGHLEVSVMSVPTGLTWISSSLTAQEFYSISFDASCTATLGANTVVLKVTNQTTGQSATGNLTVNVSAAPPTTSNAGPDQALCVGAQATLAANTASVGTGVWTVVSTPAGGSTSTGQFGNRLSPTSTFTPSVGTGTYILRWTIAGLCATSTDDVQLTFSGPNAPTTANAGPDQTLCGTSATLAANTPSVGTGAWTVVSGPSTLDSQFSSTSSPTATFTAAGGAGTYTLRWTISSASCADSTNDVVLTLRGVPTIALGASPSVLTGTTSANLPYTAKTFNPTQYSINYDTAANTAGFVDIFQATLPASPIVLVVPSAAPAATYNATLTVRNTTTGCVSSSTAITVTILNCPTSFTVNDLGDAADASAGNGVCATDGGVCTLRAAIQEANALASCSPITIGFSVNGTITLTSSLPAITRSLTINGNGITNTIVSGNNLYRSLNSIHTSGLDITVQNLTATNGAAPANYGGALDFNSTGGTLTANNVLFTNCNADFGGAINADNGTLILNNCVFTLNTSSNQGGAIWFGHTVTATITNCTVAGNTSVSYSGAVRSSAGTFNLRNSILADNISGGQCSDAGGANNIQNSLIEGGGCGITNGVNGNLTGDPALNANLTLSANSIAVNAGNNALIASGITTDIAGNARIQQSTVDMGAYESAFAGNTLPSITAGGPLSRQAGSTGTSVTIATVGDGETAAGSLTVTATTTPTGITIGTITNTNGTITAPVTAECAAITGNNTVVLTVTDGGGASSTANLTVNVTANDPPTLTYNNASVNGGTASTVSPATGPSDNGSLASIVVQSVSPSTSPATITVNNSTGVVTVPNNVPAGSYTVTIRATDNCGTTKDAPFTLTVNCVTSLTVNNLDDGADATPGNGVCETATGNGICTLRAAIQEANALTSCSPITIGFSVNGTITLDNALPEITHPNLTLTGNGAANTIISGNNAVRGLSVTADNRTLALNSLTITNANSTTNGAALSISGINNTLTLTNCVLSNNTTTTNGGGLYLAGTGTTAMLTNTTVSGNTAVSGGGLYLSISTLTLNNGTISGNTGTTGSGGGVLVTNGGTLNANDSPFSNNSSSVRGAGIASVNSSNVNVARCTFTGNTGSGVISSSLTTTITNSTISGNTGPGIDAVGGTTTVTNSTFSANTTANVFASSSGTVLNLVNTLLAGNSSCVQSSQATINATNSLIQGGLSCVNGTNTNNLTSAPLLGTLGNYGGTTQTIPLLPGSPAINAGTATGAPTSDQRGITRNIGNVDIGAFESRGFTLALANGDLQSAAVNTNFANPLAVTVTSANSEPVNGGQVTFTPPGSGTSCAIAGNPATITSGTATTGTVTANASAGGPYTVAASATGVATGVNFSLTNTGSSVLSINRASANPACVNSSVSWTVTFSQAVTGLSASNFSLVGGTGATITNVTGSGTTWTVTASTGSAAATLGLNMVNSTGVSPTVTGLPLTGQTYSVNGLPTTAQAGPDQAFCGTAAATLAANAPSVGTGVWTVVSGPSTSTSQFSSTSSPAATFTPAIGVGSYTLRWTISNAPCAVSTDDVVLTYNAVPTLTLGASPSVFPGATSANLPYVGTTGSPNQYSIDYDATANTAGFVDVTNAALPGSPIGLVVPGGAAPGVYHATLTVRTSPAGCVSSAAVPFTVTIASCPTLFTVNNTGDATDVTPGNGVCETATGNGVCTLRAAIREANALSGCSPMTINFDTAGVFATPQTITVTNGFLQITRSLTITGPGADRVKVSGNEFYISAILNGYTINLSGLTLSGGSRAVSNYGNTVNLSDCEVSGTTSAAVYNASGAMTLTNCVVKNNAGTPIGNYGAQMTISNCQITDNTGSLAIYSTGTGPFELSDSTIANNQGTGLLNAVTATVTNCRFIGNTSTTSAGAIYNNGPLTLTNCTLENNTGLQAGGIFTSSPLTLTGSTLANNTATDTNNVAGGMFTIGSPVTLLNSTFSGNRANNAVNLGAGGLEIRAGGTITNCTFTNNEVTGSGNAGGILRLGSAMAITNTIVAGNTGTSGATPDVAGAFGSGGYNLIGDGTGGSGFSALGDLAGTAGSVINPLLSALGSYGGLTKTHALLPGSPAINAGTNCVLTANGCGNNNLALSTDQRGAGFNREAGGTVDIGAFESRGFTLAYASGSPQSTNVNTAFASPLSVTVSSSNSEPVDGGQVTFTPPGSGASASLAGNPATISGGTAVSGTVTANGTGGSYSVSANANGATAAVNFALSNNVAPTVVSITRVNASPTNTGSVQFTITFSESVTGTGTGNFTLVPGGFVALASITSVTGSGTTRTVTVNTGFNTGTLGLNMTNSTGVADDDGAALSNLPFTGQVYTIDKDAPDTTITSNPSNPSNSNNATFQFTGSDGSGSGVTGFECKLDSGSFAACTSPRIYTGLSDGSHTFQVRASDVPGNGDSSPASYTWLIDTTAPAAPVVIAPANGSTTTNPLPTVTGTAEPDSTVTVFIDGSSIGTTAADGAGNWSKLLSTSLADGPHTVKASATDAAGNTSPDSNTNTFTVDTIEPDTTITVNPSDPSNSSTATFQFTGGGVGFECKLDSGSFAACTSPQIYTGLSDGSHTFQVRALDAAGNLDTTPATYIWTVDTTPPTVTINQAAGQTDPAISSPINFTLIFNEPVTGVSAGDVQLSGTAGANAFTISEIAPNDGTTYNVAVTGMSVSGTVLAAYLANSAQDAAGNLNAASTSTDNTVNFLQCPTSLTVDDLGDTPDANPGNRLCADASGKCTLRAAIEEANAGTTCSPLTINFSVTGTITLGSALPALAHPNLSLNGPGADLLTVSGANTYRVFNISNGDVTLDGLTIAQGKVTGTNAQGGGIFNTSSGTVTIRNCAIANHTALATTGGASGGGIYHKGGTLNVSGSTLSGNTAASTGVSATSTGGGMFISEQSTGSVNLTNCTIVNNSCSANGSSSNLAAGGGLYNSHLLNLTNCTISGNSVSGVSTSTRGGGLTANAGTTTLGNTIVANNTSSNATQFGGPDIGGNITSTGYNLIENTALVFIAGTTTGNQLGVDPLLAPLGNYGGPTQTFALLPGSPVIDGGTSSGAPSTDQRGLSRAGNTDIGAFESQGFTLALNGGNSQSAAAGTNFALPLSVTVTSAHSEPVNGGQVSFTPPVSGASATVAGTPATIASGTATTGTVTANATVGGPYNVVANSSGAAAPVNFALTNVAVAVAINVPPGVSFTLNSVNYTGAQNITLAPGMYTLATTSPQSLGAGTRAVFQSWSDGGDLTHSITVTSSPLTITGTFTTQYQLTTAAGTGGTVTPTSGTFYDANTVVAVTATPNLGYDFVNWTGPVANVNAAVTTVTLDAPKAITASFTNPAPAVLSLNRTNASPTNAASVQFTVMFSESMTGLSASNFTLVPGGGVSGAGITNLSGSGTTWTVTVSTGSGSGTLGLNLTNSTGVTDAGGAALSNLPFSGQVYMVDKSAPVTTITSNPANPTNSTNAALAFSATDTGGGSVASYECKLDGGSFAACTAPQSYTGLAAGSHTFQVRAIDSVGNVEGAPASFTWVVDTLAPETTITGQPGNPSNSTSATFSFSGNDGSGSGVASFECKLDSGNFAACTSPQTYSGLSEGSHTFQVRALDNAGNVDASPASYTWTVDAAQPNLTLTKSDGGAAVAPGGTVAYTLSYANTGGESATGVVLTETVPAHTTFNAAVSTGGWVCLPNHNAGSTCTLNLGSVSNGGSGTVTFAVTVVNPVAAGVTQLSNSASIADDGTHGADPQPGNNAASDTTPVNAAPDLTLSKDDANATVLPGGTVVYTLAYTNSGNQGATGVVLTETVPAGTVFNPGASTAGWTCAPNGNAGSSCTLAVGSLNGGGASGSANFAVTLATTGLAGLTPISNTASVADDNANGADSTPGNNTDTETTPRLCQPLSVGPANILSGQINQPYAQSFTQAGGLGATVFSTASTLPNGLLLAPNGVLSGTPTQSGDFALVITATDSNGCTGTAAYTLRISACPAIGLTPASLALTLGTAVNQMLTPNAGAAPFSFSLTGNLPPGLTLNGQGLLSGIPAQLGSFTFSVSVTDANQCSGTQTFTLPVTCPNLALAALSNGTFGLPYAQTIGVTPAGTYTFVLSNGALPPGLLLESATGLLHGTPVSSGTFNFRVTATGTGVLSACSSFRDYTLNILCGTVTLTPAALPGGVSGTPYNQSVTAAPGSGYTFAVSQGTLPPGLALNAGTGALTGTPAVSGSFAFQLTASAGGCQAVRAYTLEITCPVLSLPALTNVTAGVAYAQSVAATPAGTYSYTLIQGSLPPGLTLNSTSGALSGLVTATGTYGFTVQAAAASGCSVTQAYTLAVTCPAVTLNPASLPGGTAGTAYSQTFSATPAGNYSFAKTSGTLPPGLTLNSAAGELSGTPATQGTYTFTLTATGFGACAGSRSYTLVIGANCPAITLPALPATGKIAVNYSGNLAATTPSGGYTFSVESGSLPPGLAINNLFGQLAGKPTTAGTYHFTLKATRSNGCTGTRAYTVVISSALAALARIGDYDGDGKSDWTLWSGPTGAWRIIESRSQQAQQPAWGAPGDLSLLGDYDGDGQSDLAVFRPADATFYVRRSSDGGALVKSFGLSSDVPVAGDYDGDGRSDVAVWRGATGTWYLVRSSDGAVDSVAWGLSSAPYLDVPVPGDYDGDGKTDLAVFRRQTGSWLIKRSSDGKTTSQAWGLGSDVPVLGDYDGDGKTDLAVWRGATGQWFIWRSSDQAYEVTAWGAAAVGDVPAPGDYDGDGKTDLAVWREPAGQWFVRLSAAAHHSLQPQGQPGDFPVAGLRQY